MKQINQASLLLALPLLVIAMGAHAAKFKEYVFSQSTSEETPLELTNDTIYQVRNNVKYVMKEAGQSAWRLPAGRTCIINIQKGVTLTLTGGDASGTTPAGCGIEVQPNSTLYITGEGTLVATGGNAANGSAGGTPGDPVLGMDGDYAYGWAGLGGAGGAGGGGAAPGIGGRGGNGGASGAERHRGLFDPPDPDGKGPHNRTGSYAGRWEHWTWSPGWNENWQISGSGGGGGTNGGSGQSMGSVYIVGKVTVNAKVKGENAGGIGGSSGGTSSAGVRVADRALFNGYPNEKDRYKSVVICRGGPGGGGGGGGSVEYGIGGGAGGGGGGGAGGEGGARTGIDPNKPDFVRGYPGEAGLGGVKNGNDGSRYSDWYVSTDGRLDDPSSGLGGIGGAGGGAGSRGDNGSLFASPTVGLTTSPKRAPAAATAAEVDHEVGIVFRDSIDTRVKANFMARLPNPCPVLPTNTTARFRGWLLSGTDRLVYDELGQPVIDICQFADDMVLVADWENDPKVATVTVAEDGTNLGPDATGNPRVTLRDAVLAFSTNATLTGVDGLRRIMFELPEGQDTIRLQREIEIPEGAEPFEIFGLDNRTGKAVTISPDPNFGNHRFFTVSSSVSFRFLNFVGGRSSENGGAIYMLPEEQSERSKCSLVLADCSFRNNSSTGASGGAVWARWMSCSIYNCTFEGNQAKGWGGAVSVSPYHEACFVNCTFSGNRADYGGGLDVNDTRDKAPTYLVGCTFAGNSASPNHGMSISDYSKLTVLGSLFADGAEDASLLRSGSKAACTLICSSFGEPAAFFAGGATPVTNDILGVVQVAYPPLPSNAELRDAVEIYYDGLLENVAYQKPGEEVKTALCGDATKAQVRLGFDQLRAIRLCPTRGAIRLASGGDDAFVNVEGRLAVPNARNAWELNKSYTARVTVNYDDATTNVVMVPLKTSDSGYFATSVAVDGSDGYSHNVTSLTFQADAEDAASLTVPNVAVTTVPYALVAASAELVDFPEAGQVRGLETSVNSFVSEQGVVAEKMTVGGDFTAATVQGGGNLKLEGVSLRGGELAWFADGAGKTCGNLDTLDAMPFAEGGQESANGTRTWTAEADGFVQVLFVNGTGETKVSLKVGEVWITPPDGHAVKNASASESRRMLWTVPVSKGQAVEFKANGGWRNCQFIPFGK